MTCRSPLFSSVPLKSSRCPSQGPWRTLEWSNCINHPELPVSTCLRPEIWLAESPSSHCFWTVTGLQQSFTSSAGARIQASRLDVQTLLLRTDCVEAMSMRLTRGCGSSDAASPGLGIWLSSRLVTVPRKRLWLMHGTSVQQRHDKAARLLQPDLWRVVRLSIH